MGTDLQLNHKTDNKYVSPFVKVEFTQQGVSFLWIDYYGWENINYINIRVVFLSFIST